MGWIVFECIAVVSILCFYFSKCRHHWEIIETEHLDLYVNSYTKNYKCTRYHLQCTKCGTIKAQDLPRN